ncbi:VCBS repeat-containing protein [Streptomyces sp. LP05-1]|uniref:VCBS repeat-containing protein n=1 Tax=Streptomyces pyxinae TaxID=2970734 RepID=A0ABT2CDM0_9ACTN|nr:VCBS repeat-containing protein [Streptomyces sp. LP05-1]MCS0635518.1 VCBS repeat-containing protein [Streptomyces sp. LP05-1]
MTHMESYVANSLGRKRGRKLSRLAVAAAVAALVGTSAGTAVADPQPTAPEASAAAAGVGKEAFTGKAPTTATVKAGAAAPVNALFAADKSGALFMYIPNGKGAFTSRQQIGDGWDLMAASDQADHDGDGEAEGLYVWDKQGNVFYNSDDESENYEGHGWNIYDKVLVAGDLGGSSASDVLARDKTGVLWLYKGNADGSLQNRTKVGAGWGGFDQLVGKGDLSGDGRADIVARDKSGVLWLYQGTGNPAAPFKARTKVGSGWNTFNYLVSTGDLNADGHTDLIGRDAKGALWRYDGTGNAAAPFKARTQIGASGWNIYTMMF